MASRRQLILLEMLNRVSAIKKSDGFNTDAGFAPYLGEPVILGESDPEVAVAVVPREDGVISCRENVSVRLPIEIQAIARADINQPWLAVESLIADIKMAIELPDRSLGGLIPGHIARGSTRAMLRDVGSTTVGAAITYWMIHAEAWGAP